jgi:hypothetical protein
VSSTDVVPFLLVSTRISGRDPQIRWRGRYPGVDIECAHRQ